MGLLATGAVQLVAVHAFGVSRWRGGGMGMYTEFHPNETVVIAVVDGERREVEEWRCQRVPTRACLADALVDHPDAVRLEAWRPRFDPVTRSWRRVEVARASR
ncbi:MAG: hypothetical protein ABMA64_38780 [Myxococcota bacterium]